MQRELVHEVFVKAFTESARRAYDGLRPYAPWLSRIARNVLVDQWRKHGGEAVAVGDLAALDALEAQAAGASRPGSADPADDLHWRTLREATQACIAKLDVEARRFVELRYVEDLPQRDGAERLGVTRRRVRTLDALVLARVRKHLEEGGLA